MTLDNPLPMSNQATRFTGRHMPGFVLHRDDQWLPEALKRHLAHHMDDRQDGLFSAVVPVQHGSRDRELGFPRSGRFLRIPRTNLWTFPAGMDVEREDPSPIPPEDCRVGRRAAAPNTLSDGAY